MPISQGSRRARWAASFLLPLLWLACGIGCAGSGASRVSYAARVVDRAASGGCKAGTASIRAEGLTPGETLEVWLLGEQLGGFKDGKVHHPRELGGMQVATATTRPDGSLVVAFDVAVATTPKVLEIWLYGPANGTVYPTVTTLSCE